VTLQKIILATVVVLLSLGGAQQCGMAMEGAKIRANMNDLCKTNRKFTIEGYKGTFRCRGVSK